MKRCMLCFPIVLVLLMISSTGSAQTQKKSQNSEFTPYWQLNLNGGTSLFFGDVKQKALWPTSLNGHSEWRMGGGLMLSRQFTPFFGLRGQGLYGQLSGIKTNSNQYFQSDYLEFNLNGTFNLNTLFAGYKPDRKVNFFLMAGIGLTNYNSTLYDLTTGDVLRKRGFGNGHGLGHRTLEGVAIVGAGVSFKLSDQVNLNLETANRIMNSDAMDLHVKNYKYDIYNYTSLGIAIKFGGKKHVKSVPQQMQIPKPFTPNPAVVSPKKTNEQKTQTTTKNTGMPVQPPPTKTQQTPLETIKKAQQKPPAEHQIKTPVRKITPVKPILEYRVQIRARYEKPVSLSYLSQHYNIQQNRIRTDTFNGYYIYTVGSYETYGQAKVERDILRSTNGVTDAFVVAFKNGRRLAKLP